VGGGGASPFGHFSILLIPLKSADYRKLTVIFFFFKIACRHFL